MALTIPNSIVSYFSSSDKEFIGELQIVLSTVSFSCAFVGQRYAMVDGNIGPITFNATRYVASLILLIILQPVLKKFSTIDDSVATADDELYLVRNGGNRSLLYWILVAGLSNFGGSMLQQYSLVNLEAAKVAFITGSYVVLIPFVEVSRSYAHLSNVTSSTVAASRIIRTPSQLH
jgi:drug/metabolite transporter (DMT)-like permease